MTMAGDAEDTPAIYLHGIRRQYRQGEAVLTILDGAKLALWPGQSVALVAPSGSGKSTLLHIAGLLETPDDGEVDVALRPVLAAGDGAEDGEVADAAAAEFRLLRGEALAESVEVGGQHGSDPGGTSAKLGCVNSDVFL